MSAAADGSWWLVGAPALLALGAALLCLWARQTDPEARRIAGLEYVIDEAGDLEGEELRLVLVRLEREAQCGLDMDPGDPFDRAVLEGVRELSDGVPYLQRRYYDELPGA